MEVRLNEFYPKFMKMIRNKKRVKSVFLFLFVKLLPDFTKKVYTCYTYFSELMKQYQIKNSLQDVLKLYYYF